MKRYILLITLFYIFVSNVFSQSLKVDFSTVPITSGTASNYSPKHILAVWVETSNGAFVSSLKVMAQTRINYLTKWKTASNSSKVNAITGATISSHTSHSITWNCKKYDGTIITEGNYKLCIELTSGNTTGTYSETTFTIGRDSFTTNASTVTNAKNLVLKYTPNIPDNTTTIEIPTYQNVASVTPNPFTDQTKVSFFTNLQGPYKIDIIDQIGKTIYTFKGQTISGENIVTINTKVPGLRMPSSYYFCIINTNEYRTSLKMLKK